MKIIKKIGIVLLAIILLLVVIAFFLPSKVHVERTTEIKATPETVFGLVNNLKQWEVWSPWHSIDSNMKLTYSDIPEGKDAFYSWTSQNRNVGNGKLTIVECNPATLLKTKLEFEGMDPSYADFIFEANGDQTKVTWTMDSDMGFNLIGRYFGLFMDKMIGPDYEKGLSNLKKAAESTPVKVTIAGFDFEERTMDPMNVLGIRNKVKLSELMSDKFSGWYRSINHTMAMQKLTMTGAPMSIYYSYDAQTTDLEAAIPVKGEGKNDGDVKFHAIPGGKTLVVHYFGNYGNLEPVYNAAFEYIANNGMKSNGPPMEIYVTDPVIEKDTAKWLTELVFPIQ